MPYEVLRTADSGRPQEGGDEDRSVHKRIRMAPQTRRMEAAISAISGVSGISETCKISEISAISAISEILLGCLPLLPRSIAAPCTHTKVEHLMVPDPRAEPLTIITVRLVEHAKDAQVTTTHTH